MTTETLANVITLDYLLQLHKHGWGVIPLKPGRKAPPPAGLTGDDGKDLTPEQIRTQHKAGAFGNVAIRLPRGVVGVDVDNYGTKPGMISWQKLQAIAEEAGTPIPETVRITSRADRCLFSGIYLFRAILPSGHTWVNGLDGIDILRHGHRYAVCPPSIHPEGRPYEALNESTGELLEIVPAVSSLPWLPAAVIGELVTPVEVQREHGEATTTAQVREDPERGNAPACTAVERASKNARADLTGGASRHDATVDNVLALARLHEQGHRGALRALDELRAAFIHAVTTGGGLTRTASEAQHEYESAVHWVWDKIAGSPTPPDKKGCCGEASTRYEVPAWDAPETTAEVNNTDKHADLEEALRAPWDEAIKPVELFGPPVDISGLPAVVRDMVEAHAEQSQAPREVVLAAALGTLAAATRGVWQVRVHDGWDAGPTVLWCLTLALSGERKGAGQAPLLRPLEEVERTLAAEVRRLNRNRATERKRLEEALKEIEKGTGNPLDQAHLTEQLHNARPRPVPHLIVSDATTEAVGMCMTEQGGALALFSTEAQAFQTIAGRYSDAGANVGLLNQAYDAERYSDLRIRRAGVRVDRPTFTWCTAVQPEVLAGYADHQTEGSGFLNRFALFLPESMIGRHNMRSTPVPGQISAAWAATIGNIHAAAWQRYQPMTDDLPDELGPVPVLTFERDAAEMMIQYAEHLEARQGPHTPLANLAGWLSKHPARIARMAALFALTENPERSTVPVWAVESALTLAEPMITHALATYRVLRQVRANNNAEHRVIEALRQVDAPTVTTREMFARLRGQTSWVEKTDDVARALEHLSELGWVRGPFKVHGPQGGRPTDVWAIHPNLQN